MVKNSEITNKEFAKFLVLFAFVVLGLVSSVLHGLHQEIGWKERLRNELFCVEYGT